MCPNPEAFVLFTEEILNGKLHILCSVYSSLLIKMMSCFCGMVDRRRRLAIFPAIVRNPHHREYPVHGEQDLNLLRT